MRPEWLIVVLNPPPGRKSISDSCMYVICVCDKPEATSY